jgi:hypothetical protein
MSELLLQAALKGKMDFVVRALDRGDDVDFAYEDGITALMNAAEAGHSEIVRLLIERGATVDRLDSNGNSALFVAAYCGWHEAISILLDAGAEVALPGAGETALHRAAYGGKCDREINLLEPRNPFAPEGHTEALRVLLSHGADVNALDEAGWSPLMYAMGGGHADVVQLLLEAGADVNITAVDGATAIQLAQDNGHNHIVELLRASGAS